MTKIAYFYTESGEYHGFSPIEKNHYTGEYNFPDNTTTEKPVFEEGKTPYRVNGVWVNN